MGKLPFSEKYLLKTYKNGVNELLEVCDWKTYVEDQDICVIIAHTCNEHKVKITAPELLSLYRAKIKSLNLTTEQWRDKYGSWETGMPKIVSMIYKILENYHK